MFTEAERSAIRRLVKEALAEALAEEGRRGPGTREARERLEREAGLAEAAEEAVAEAREALAGDPDWHGRDGYEPAWDPEALNRSVRQAVAREMEEHREQEAIDELTREVRQGFQRLQGNRLRPRPLVAGAAKANGAAAGRGAGQAERSPEAAGAKAAAGGPAGKAGGKAAGAPGTLGSELQGALARLQEVLQQAEQVVRQLDQMVRR